MGMAPETVIVSTATLSATITVKVTVVVCEEVETTTAVDVDVKEEMAGPVESLFVIVTVSVSVEILPSTSVTLIVKVCPTVPNEKWSASYNLLQT